MVGIMSSPRSYTGDILNSWPGCKFVPYPIFLISGRIFNIAINEEIRGEEAARQRLDELAAAANDIAQSDPTHRAYSFLPYVLDNDEAPKAILGPSRKEGDLDIRVVIYPPGQHPKIGR
jgi:hypothetical protein